jgi:hypothetical protein
VVVLAFGCDEVHFKEYFMFGLGRTQLPKLFHSNLQMSLLFRHDEINVKIVVKYKEEETPDVIDIRGKCVCIPLIKS